MRSKRYYDDLLAGLIERVNYLDRRVAGVEVTDPVSGISHASLADLTTGDPHTQYVKPSYGTIPVFLLPVWNGDRTLTHSTSVTHTGYFEVIGDVVFGAGSGDTKVGGLMGINVAPSTSAQLDVVSGDAGRIGMRVKSATSPTALTVDVGDYGSPQFANAAMGVRRDVDNITALLLQNASTGTGADVRIAMYVSGDVADGSLAFSLPGTANAGSAIFNLARATSAFLFSRNRALGIGTFESHDLVLGTNNAARMIVKSDGKVGIGGTAPSGKTHIDQSSTTAAIPVLILDQADLSEEFVQFNTTVGAGNPVDTAAVGTYYGKIRVSVNGTAKYIALYNS